LHLQVIRPIAITPDKILSSTATESVSAWNIATTYADGNTVLYQDNIYESLQNSNTGNNPATASTFWLKIAPSNKTAMFDNEVNTQTTGTSPLVVEVQPMRIFNSVGFVNVEANTIQLKVYDEPAGTVVFDETIDLDDSDILDWYSYFFAEFDLRNDAVFDNIPPYATGVAEVTVTSGATVKVGGMILGNLLDVGLTQYGLNYGIRDYSIKETDDFGNTTFVRRNFSKRMEPTAMLDNLRLNLVSKALTELRAVPTVWIGSDDNRFQGTIVYGYLRDWNTEINYPTSSMLSLQIEGLV
jgi:hypothetical protein